MTKEFYSLVTNIGLQKIQEALENGTKLDLKYIAVGDSNGAYYEPSYVIAKAYKNGEF